MSNGSSTEISIRYKLGTFLRDCDSIQIVSLEYTAFCQDYFYISTLADEKGAIMSKQFLVFGGILIMMCIVFAEPEKTETHLRKSPNPDLRGFLALVRNRRAEGECGDTNDQCTFEQDRCCSGLYCKSSKWSAFCTAVKQKIVGDSADSDDLSGALFATLHFKGVE